MKNTPDFVLSKNIRHFVQNAACVDSHVVTHQTPHSLGRFRFGPIFGILMAARDRFQRGFEGFRVCGRFRGDNGIKRRAKLLEGKFISDVRSLHKERPLESEGTSATNQLSAFTWFLWTTNDLHFHFSLRWPIFASYHFKYLAIHHKRQRTLFYRSRLLSQSDIIPPLRHAFTSHQPTPQTLILLPHLSLLRFLIAQDRKRGLRRRHRRNSAQSLRGRQHRASAIRAHFLQHSEVPIRRRLLAFLLDLLQTADRGHRQSLALDRREQGIGKLAAFALCFAVIDAFSTHSTMELVLVSFQHVQGLGTASD